MPKIKSKPRRAVVPTSRYSFMDATELAEATREFDEEFVGERSAPLTAAEERISAKARRAGRPKIGNGAKVISITVERSLLGRLDAYVQDTGLSRAQAVAMALKLMLGVTQSPTPRRRAEPAMPAGA